MLAIGLASALSCGWLFGVQPQSALAEGNDVYDVGVASAEVEFSFTTERGHKYTVGYTIAPTASVDPLVGKSGNAALTIDYADSVFRVVNQTGRAAPGLQMRIAPFYQSEDGLVGMFSHVSEVVEEDWTRGDPDWHMYKLSDMSGYGNLLLSGGTFSSAPSIDDGQAGEYPIVPLSENGTTGLVPESVVEELCANVIWVAFLYEVRDPDGPNQGGGIPSRKILLSEGTFVYGDLTDNGIFGGKNGQVLNDPIAAMKGASTGGGGDSHSLGYSPGSGESVDLVANGKIDELLTTQSYESMKLYMMVEAAHEMAIKNGYSSGEWVGGDYLSYMSNFFIDVLGFDKCEPFNTGESYLDDDAQGWFAYRQMSDGRDLIFTFVQGTDGKISELSPQWLSNGNYDNSLLSKLVSEKHKGFDTAADKVAAELVLFAHEVGVDLGNTFFAFDGYSRGAAIVDLLATSSSLPGTDISLTAENCMAYTFEAPNTVSKTPAMKRSYVVDVVDGSDVITYWPPTWHKNGTVLGYTHSQDAIKQFYKTDQIDDPPLIGGHMFDNVIAQVFSNEPSDVYDRAKTDHVVNDCPTNVKVMDGNEVIASVIDDVATSNGDVLVIASQDGKKDVFAPHDAGYRFIIEVTADGAMDVVVNVLGDDSQASVNEPISYTIRKGQVYEIDLETGKAALSDGRGDSPAGSDSGDILTWTSLGRMFVAGVIVAIVIFISVVVIKVSNRSRRRKSTSNYR
jgi:hypothetical protein